MSSAEPDAELDKVECTRLLDIARAAIGAGVGGRRPTVPFGELTPSLRRPQATFVTIEHGGSLRGCIGTLEAFRPLAIDVAENAYAAAFNDPRFPPVGAGEVDGLDIHISLLGAAQPMMFTSEADLIRQLRPGIDGLVLDELGRRATLLPSVWESITDAREFLRHLKLKAGLPGDHWSTTLAVSRYTTRSIP
jgi:AmmeMemoRadiSam system protein A